jgi:hypothetical protein
METYEKDFSKADGERERERGRERMSELEKITWAIFQSVSFSWNPFKSVSKEWKFSASKSFELILLPLPSPYLLPLLSPSLLLHHQTFDDFISDIKMSIRRNPFVHKHVRLHAAVPVWGKKKRQDKRKELWCVKNERSLGERGRETWERDLRGSRMNCWWVWNTFERLLKKRKRGKDKKKEKERERGEERRGEEREREGERERKRERPCGTPITNGDSMRKSGRRWREKGEEEEEKEEVSGHTHVHEGEIGRKRRERGDEIDISIL